MMVSKDKLIKQGIKYTDALFAEIVKRLEQGVRSSDTLEAFLEATKEYTTNNPLVSTGYAETMLALILSETNNHKFSRPSQRELTRTTIENYVGNLITNVGEDIKARVRAIVTEEYNNPEGSNPQRMAKRISDEVEGIKNKRATAIARTEIARTSTVSDYIIAKERGATHYTVNCRSTRCDICKKRYCKTNKTGGDVEYSIEDTEHLPPLHPNCYMPDTKVFTSKGWKYFKDITVDDKILSLNPLTEEIEFLPYVKLVEVDNSSGLMYHIFNKWFDICITPDHDCFVSQRVDRNYEFQFRKPNELTDESNFIRCIDYDKTGVDVIKVGDLKFKSSDFAFFMGWYLSGGSVLHNEDSAKKRNYPIKIAQLNKILEKELVRICDYLNIKLYIGKEYFELHSKELHDYLLPLGYSHEKYIPSEVYQLNNADLRIFIDNYSKEKTIVSSSKKMIDGLSYIALLIGYNPTIINDKYTSNHDVFCIRLNKSKRNNYANLNTELISYDGKVYCVELPKYHTLWVMRNGKTSWNGNCRCSANFYRKK